MARKIRIEAPTDLTLKLFLYAFTGSGTPDTNGYALTEVSPRAYEMTIPDDALQGVFYCSIYYIAQDATIDSGYVNLESADSTYLLSNSPPAPSTTEIPETSYSAYGPKRVKTKEMEIEQFSPMEIQRAEDRAAAPLPCFGSSHVCVGRNKNVRYYK